eukprot:TRINITY_DN44591_c0_g1_i1.p2 TRINITY_DN44591_c0_g1~~TRINITY_DN44591_c0_g1_i1.p2  ORF type:complete len:162 (+),score=14.50 TRINITY_DN44591_c0_g1_i1:203-688(+)
MTQVAKVSCGGFYSLSQSTGPEAGRLCSRMFLYMCLQMHKCRWPAFTDLQKLQRTYLRSLRISIGLLGSDLSASSSSECRRRIVTSRLEKQNDVAQAIKIGTEYVTKMVVLIRGEADAVEAKCRAASTLIAASQKIIMSLGSCAAWSSCLKRSPSTCPVLL